VINLSTIEKRISKFEHTRDSQEPLSHLTDEELVEHTNNFLVRIDAGFQLKSLWDREGFEQYITFAKQMKLDAEAAMKLEASENRKSEQ